MFCFVLHRSICESIFVWPWKVRSSWLKKRKLFIFKELSVLNAAHLHLEIFPWSHSFHRWNRCCRNRSPLNSAIWWSTSSTTEIRSNTATAVLKIIFKVLKVQTSRTNKFYNTQKALWQKIFTSLSIIFNVFISICENCSIFEMTEFKMLYKMVMCVCFLKFKSLSELLIWCSSFLITGVFHTGYFSCAVILGLQMSHPAL